MVINIDGELYRDVEFKLKLVKNTLKCIGKDWRRRSFFPPIRARTERSGLSFFSIALRLLQGKLPAKRIGRTAEDLFFAALARRVLPGSFLSVSR